MSQRAWGRGLSAAAMAFALAPPFAFADVRRQGQWADDPVVSLDVDAVPRSEALGRLAKAAGWSVVVHAPKDDRVSLHVTDQPAGKVLDLLLDDGRYVAVRDGKLISVSPDPGVDPAAPQIPVPPVPPVAPVPPVPPVAPVAPIPPPPPPAASDDDDDDRDRTVTGGSLRIEKGEVAHDVTVMGGNLDVWGTVTGDLTVLGGTARIHDGAHVVGDATVMGGSLDIESGAAIDGDVGVLGGTLHRADGAKIRGEIKDGARKEKRRARREARRNKDESAGEHASAEQPKSRLRSVADAVNGAALLFVFGAVLLALVPERMDKLKLQIATRPMRTFATGLVSLLAGIVILCAVCVTIIGIPVAVVAALAAVLATFAGICSVLETVGAALLGHRTKNPYVHLALGSLLFLVAGAVPFIGGLVKLAVILTAIGSVVATRGAGLLPGKLRHGSPYRETANT